MNRYLAYYAEKNNPEEFGFISASTFTDPLKVAYDMYTKKGVGYVAEGLVTGVKDYSQVQEESARRNQDAYKYKIQVALQYRDAPAWSENIPRKVTNIGKAYPNLPSLSGVVLGVPPNSPADAYAQGAAFAFISAKMFSNRKEAEESFIQLGNQFIKEARKASNKIDKTNTIQVAKIMRGIVRKWTEVATQTGVISSWYNLIGQIQNLIKGDEVAARSIQDRMKLHGKLDEINFSKEIAADSQASIWDLLYIMRGWIGLAGIILIAVFAGPALLGIAKGAGTAIGRAAPKIAGKAGKAASRIGKAAGKTAKKISDAMGKEVQQAVMQTLNDTKNNPDFKQALASLTAQLQNKGVPLSSQLENQIVRAQQNPTLTEEDLKRIIRQILAETGA